MIINIADDHKDPQDSQLIIVLTGTPEYIHRGLESMTKWYGTERKPIQGTSISNDGRGSIITPIWEGKEY